MKKMAVFLYKRICILGIPLFCRKQVETDLTGLHPGERVEYIKTEYYVKKITLFLTVLFVGAFLGLVVKVNGKRDAVLSEGGVVHRGSYQSGEQKLFLKADDGEKESSFLIEVSPRELTKEETEQLFDSFLQNLGSYVLNGNKDFSCVYENLKLEESYGDLPFTVSWESSREEVIDRQGRIGQIKEAVSLELTVNLMYGKYQRTENIPVTVVPFVLTEEEQAYLELKEYLLKTEEESRDTETWMLPDEWKGRKMKWSYQKKDFSVFVWASTPAVAAVLYLFADRDLHEELEKRRRRLQQEYPDLVHKILLYVGAGMTIRGAFQKIAGDYEKKKGKKSNIQPGCEEVLYTCRELQGGVSEGAAYEHFGKRTGLREYIRLGTLLGQNLKRGNSTLTERLREEAEKSSAESLLRVRRLGEEAGTKLLVPMVIMLAVIMVMIMVPAFGTM